MTPSDLGQQIKKKFPGTYDQYPDEVIGQRTLVKYPQYQDIMDKDLGGTVKKMFTKPASALIDLGTNPETMAKAMPATMGTAGGIVYPFGGATFGTGIGQAIRDASLKVLNKPIPGVEQHLKELGTAVGGDVLSGFGQAAHYGSEIGKAERGAGVITRGATKGVTTGSVGQTLTDLEAQLDSGLIRTPQEARDAKEVVDQVYKNPRIYEQTPGIDVQAQRVAKKVSDAYAASLPSRAFPSSQYARVMTVPNMIQDTWQSVPTPVKWGLGLGAGTSAGMAGTDLLGRALSAIGIGRR